MAERIWELVGSTFLVRGRHVRRRSDSRGWRARPITIQKLHIRRVHYVYVEFFEQHFPTFLEEFRSVQSQSSSAADTDLFLWSAQFQLISLYPTGDGREDDAEDGERPEIPEGVLCGIEDIAEGRTASKEDLESLLKY